MPLLNKLHCMMFGHGELVARLRFEDGQIVTYYECNKCGKVVGYEYYY